MLNVGRPLEDMNLREISRVRVAPFLLRVAIFVGLSAAFIALILTTHGVVSFLGMVLLGLMYGHAVELQHQALHNTAFPSKFWNRFVGFFLGLPMLVSFSDYQWSHLRHHRLLGTKDDREFFNYGYDRLTSLKPLLRHLLMVSHYRDVTRFIASSVLGKVKPGIKEENARHIRSEYQWMAFFIVLAVVVSAVFKTTLFVKLWLVPLLFAIPTHALIELPEHWGRDHDTLNVAENTRTIKTGIIGYWFTNGNNYHIEHHWLPAVPNDRFLELHRRIADQVDSDTYPAFFKRFLGELYRNTFRKSGSGGEQEGAAA
jgi:fatty acid desaturase